MRHLAKKGALVPAYNTGKEKATEERKKALEAKKKAKEEGKGAGAGGAAASSSGVVHDADDDNVYD